MRVIVTTSQRASSGEKDEARALAAAFQARYVERNKQSVAKLAAFYECPVFVVSKERFELHDGESHPFFFHPGSAMFRVKRLLAGQRDELVSACGLTEGMSFFDGTMGPAADSITAAAAVGASGGVIASEANPLIACVVEQGLQKWQEGPAPLLDAMKRITVQRGKAVDVLSAMPDRSVDVVYFDPMFEEAVDSAGIAPLRPFASSAGIDEDTIQEAKRVARKRVVLKDHFRSSRFQAFGFKQQIRKTAKFHFGVMEVEHEQQ